LFTVFKGSAIWIWENLDNQTINNMLKEHGEIHRDPEEKAREKMKQELNYQMENNPLVKAFMD
jgi:serine/threonine protein phosphatase PrpC